MLRLALSGGLTGVTIGVVLWGLHMGFTQGLLATLIADTAPPELRGTAYGVFNLLGGLAALVASVLAGALWDSFGPQATFLTEARARPAASSSRRRPSRIRRRWSGSRRCRASSPAR